jgi:hypothetical protein
MIIRNKYVVSAGLLIGLISQPVLAQLTLPEPSPSATVKQKIGFTDLTIAYSRPGVKGRTIFGGLVPYGKIWRTGASDATILTLTDPVKLGGKSLPAGNYSLFTIPNRGEWTVILNKHVGGHGLEGYDEKNDVIRFAAKSDSSTRFYESFTIEVQDLVRNQANIYLNWANTSVHFPLVSNADERITSQIQERVKTATDDDAGTFFQAATYYFEQDKETKQALAWASKAAQLKPTYNYLHLLAKLQARAGDYKSAVTTARKASELATEKKLTEFVTLNNRLIAEWEKKL